jgi:hypothetical protein
MLARTVRSYLSVRRAAGFSLRQVDLHLRSFASSPSSPPPQRSNPSSPTWASPPLHPNWPRHGAPRCGIRRPSRCPTGMRPQRPCPSTCSTSARAGDPPPSRPAHHQPLCHGSMIPAARARPRSRPRPLGLSPSSPSTTPRWPPSRLASASQAPPRPSHTPPRASHHA